MRPTDWEAMRLRPATAPRGQALVLRRWIVIASRARVNIRVCLERLSRHVHFLD